MKRILVASVAALFLVPGTGLAQAAPVPAPPSAPPPGWMRPVSPPPRSYQVSADHRTALVSFLNGDCEHEFRGSLRIVGGRPTLFVEGFITGNCDVTTRLSWVSVDISTAKDPTRFYDFDGKQIPFEGFRKPGR